MRVVNGRRQTVIGVSRIFRNLRTSHLKTPLLKVFGGRDTQLITSELKPLTKAFENIYIYIYINPPHGRSTAPGASPPSTAKTENLKTSLSKSMLFFKISTPPYQNPCYFGHWSTAPKAPPPTKSQEVKFQHLPIKIHVLQNIKTQEIQNKYKNNMKLSQIYTTNDQTLSVGIFC